jgi:hypothetical protein
VSQQKEHQPAIHLLIAFIIIFLPVSPESVITADRMLPFLVYYK